MYEKFIFHYVGLFNTINMGRRIGSCKVLLLIRYAKNKIVFKLKWLSNNNVVFIVKNM